LRRFLVQSVEFTLIHFVVVVVDVLVIVDDFHSAMIQNIQQLMKFSTDSALTLISPVVYPSISSFSSSAYRRMTDISSDSLSGLVWQPFHEWNPKVNLQQNQRLKFRPKT
jgi:hypothetical protein